MELAENQITLEQLPTGSRLIVRSKLDWRFAAISKRVDERIVITVCSPNGRTYRLRRELSSKINLEGPIPILEHEVSDTWRDNFSRYDSRW